MDALVTFVGCLGIALLLLVIGLAAGTEHGRQSVPPVTDPVFCIPFDLGTNEPERPQ